MKYIIILFMILFFFGCASKPIATHKEQLILDVPQELLKEPKPLKTL